MIKRRGRVEGLDVHPDSFAGAVVEGTDPASAQVLSSSMRVELEQLEQWALRHTRTKDAGVGGQWQRLCGGRALACDRPRGRDPGQSSCRQGGQSLLCQRSGGCSQIARIFLSALSPIVWQPDPKTLERREIFSAYQAVVKESTRAKQQLRSMLNEHCVRLEKGFRLCHPTRSLACLRYGSGRRRAPCCCNSCTVVWWQREHVAPCCAVTWRRKSRPRKRCCA